MSDQGKTIHESLKKSILRLWQQGVSRRQIAANLQVSKSTVEKYIRRHIAGLGD